MTVLSEVRRPALRYLGGKFMLAPTLIGMFPAHKVYVEPFCGGASVLLRKPRSYNEVINDLDHDIVTMFEVLRDPELSARLIKAIELTPFAREEFDRSYVPAEDPVEQTRRLIARSFMGFGSNAANPQRTTGFRLSSAASGTSPAADWRNMPESLYTIAQRCRGVAVEKKPALEVIKATDAHDTLFFVDPPYVHSTRSSKRVRGALYNAYRHEMTDEQHEELLGVLRGVKGMVVLTGYKHPIYDKALADWNLTKVKAMADGARPRTEMIWRNAAAMKNAGLFGADH